MADAFFQPGSLSVFAGTRSAWVITWYVAILAPASAPRSVLLPHYVPELWHVLSVVTQSCPELHSGSGNAAALALVENSMSSKFFYITSVSFVSGHLKIFMYQGERCQVACVCKSHV